MDKFADLLDKALHRAVERFSVSHPQDDVREVFEIHAPRFEGITEDKRQLVQIISLSDGMYHAVIDVGVINNDELGYIYFIRPSGHAQRSFEETFDPDDLGPFKVLETL